MPSVIPVYQIIHALKAPITYQARPTMRSYSSRSHCLLRPCSKDSFFYQGRSQGSKYLAVTIWVRSTLQIPFVQMQRFQK